MLNINCYNILNLLKSYKYIVIFNILFLILFIKPTIMLSSDSVLDSMWADSWVQENLNMSDFDDWPNKYGSIKGPIQLYNVIQNYSIDSVEINSYRHGCSVSSDSIYISVNIYENCYDAQRSFLIYKAYNVAYFEETTNDSLVGDVCEYIDYGSKKRLIMTINNHLYDMNTMHDSTTAIQIMNDIETAVNNNPSLNSIEASSTRPIVSEIILPDTLFKIWSRPEGLEVKVLFQNQSEILNAIIRLHSETIHESIYLDHAINDTFRLGYCGTKYGIIKGDLSNVEEVELWISAINKRGEKADTTIILEP